MRYNTGNPVEPNGSNDPFDHHDNTANLDLAVNGGALTWPDRKFKPRKSWAGMEADFAAKLLATGFESIHLIYGAGVIVDRATQLVERAGVFYRVTNQVDLPLNLSGVWATDALKLTDSGDGSLRAALAAGTVPIKYRHRTVVDRLDDIANPMDHGAIADGNVHWLSTRYGSLTAAQIDYPFVTSLTTEDIDWAAIQSALNAGTARVHFSAGHYRPTKGNLRTTDVVYTSDGPSARVDYSSAHTAGGLLNQGILFQLGNLASNISEGARTINFLAAPDLVPGDVLIAYNPTDGSWLADRTPYRDGEMWRVHSIVGNAVTIYGNSTSGYVAANMQMWRLRGISVYADALHFSPSDTYSVAPFKVVLGDTVKINSFSASDVDLYTGLEVERCFDVTINSPSISNRSPAVGDEYGVTVSNCQNVVVTGGSVGSTRHAVALGGMDDVCCVPNRNVLIYGMLVENIELVSDIGAGDMHGNADNIVYDNCIFRNGAIMQGRNATIRNSTIYGVTSVSGECIYGTEVYGGTYTIENNRFISYGDGASFGYVHISPSITQKRALDLVCRDNTWELPNATGSSKVVFMRARNSSFPCNAIVDGVHVIRATVAMQAFLFADDNVKAALLSDYLIVDNVYGPAGTTMLYPVSDIAAVPTRQMRQSGWVDVASAAAQTVAAPAQTFRYPYSKMPTPATPAIYSTTGADQSLIGTVAPIPKLYALSATTIRPAMVAPTGAFALGTTVRMGWEVGINDV